MSHYASGRWNTFKLNYMINQSKLKKITISTFINSKIKENKDTEDIKNLR
jgi:hypothetical protein